MENLYQIFCVHEEHGKVVHGVHARDDDMIMDDDNVDDDKSDDKKSGS